MPKTQISHIFELSIMNLIGFNILLLQVITIVITYVALMLKFVQTLALGKLDGHGNSIIDNKTAMATTYTYE